MADKAMSSDVEVVDVLGPMLKSIEKSTGLLPKNQAGLIHSLDHEYFKRVEAVEFAVKYDDGKKSSGPFEGGRCYYRRFPYLQNSAEHVSGT